MIRIKKRQAIMLGMMLGCASIFVAFAIILAQQNTQIQKLSASDTERAKQVQTLSKRIGDYTYSPHSLNECLSTAATEYTNYIKSTGKASSDPTKGMSYSLTSAEWERADTKLKADEANCKALFDKR
jgi:predicted PurR-regulated permease PerM